MGRANMIETIIGAVVVLIGALGGKAFFASRKAAKLENHLEAIQKAETAHVVGAKARLDAVRETAPAITQIDTKRRRDFERVD